MKSKGNRLFQESLSAITGTPLLGAAPPFPPLGGETWPLSGKGPFARELAELLLPLTGLSGEESARFRQILTEEIETAQTEAEELLGKTSGVIQNLWERLFAETSAAPEDDHLREKLAEAAGKLWLPELGMEDAEILQRWILKDPRENPHPLKPEEVVLQLNALYTEPEDIPSAAWEKVLKEAYQAASPEDRETQAEYDHPVPLFAPPKEHELEGCLAELEGDLAFEKDQGTLPRDHKMPVIVSVSLTHPYLDGPAERWLRELLKKEEFQHLRVLFLTEEVLTKYQSTLFQSPYPVFTVMGRYSRHFNTLKYAQLLMEKGFGIRGGFKLDTDEGIRSRELFESTGKTWLQTLCHPYWGGSARDWKDRPVVLGINEGEYVDSRDIERLGYKSALREPDVKLPASRLGEELFFPKGIAHARATALYNREGSWDRLLSHPVVKGGGYGITNDSLRGARPFAHSRVGRAEDQQFYFSALPSGVRGVFAPDLRIAHYKSSVAKSEEKTEASRLLGDMARLILFHHLITELGIKEDLDPMPGVFASPLARPQALFHLLYRCWCFHRRGKETTARVLLVRGVPELRQLREEIGDGTILREWEEEGRQWESLVKEIDRLDPQKVKETLDPLFV